MEVLINKLPLFLDNKIYLNKGMNYCHEICEPLEIRGPLAAGLSCFFYLFGKCETLRTKVRIFFLSSYDSNWMSTAAWFFQ